MDYLQRFIRQAQLRIWGLLLINTAVLADLGWITYRLGLHGWTLVSAVTGLAALETIFVAYIMGKMLLEPLRIIWLTVLHLAPSTNGMAPPRPSSLPFGRELVTTLSSHIYELTKVSPPVDGGHFKTDLAHSFLALNLPLPLFILDAKDTISFTNQAAADYLGLKEAAMVGQNVYSILNMSFPSEDTFDSWLKSSKTGKATATSTWERVRLNARDTHPARLFDLAAYYNRDNPEHIETMVVLFDHTKQYSQDDQAISFTALAVHELRTPLTVLRGYIEALDEELQGQISPELQNFIIKMQAQAEQLMAFVNNILNVARVDDDQLELKLQSEDWSTTLKSSIEAIGLQAKVRGITLQCRIATNLPPVAIDRLSIREVLNNLVDNAIKYSGHSKVIKINSYLNKEGLVETTVQDFGLGIPTSILPNLFTKFYRDHHNRARIGGTGLGLYLSKAIISAHGGNLWVRSQGQNQGSIFGFTILPHAKLPEAMKHEDIDGEGVTRSAHGWIKNHSLYRR